MQDSRVKNARIAFPPPENSPAAKAFTMSALTTSFAPKLRFMRRLRCRVALELRGQRKEHTGGTGWFGPQLVMLTLSKSGG